MSIDQLVKKVDRRSLTNTQRVLFSLLRRNGEWMARTTLRIPNVGSRFRDLRKDKFGGFDVECVLAKDLKSQRRVRPSKLTNQQTFYRLNPQSVTTKSLMKALKGVI